MQPLDPLEERQAAHRLSNTRWRNSLKGSRWQRVYWATYRQRPEVKLRRCLQQQLRRQRL